MSDTHVAVRSEGPGSVAATDMRITGLRQVLQAIAAALVRNDTRRGLEATFEQEVQQALDLRGVRLREVKARYQARLVTPTRTSDSIVLGVPMSNPESQAVVEVACHPDRPLQEPDLDTLTLLAHLGGLVLEVARSRTIGAGAPAGPGQLIGSSSAMQALRKQIERVSATDFTVLIEGESGTGKELVAHQLHEQSRRRRGPFVALNCAAVVETLLEAELFGIEDRTATGVRGRRGKFEQADGGTLFLDEVSDLSPAAQAKLLRVLQDLEIVRVGSHGARRVDTRVVAATNRPLSELVAQGIFRADLYYRLSGVDIRVPPLRARREDIPELVAHFLRRHRTDPALTISAEAQQALRVHLWPGNVRELERLIERALALVESDRVELDDLPPHVRGEFKEVLGASLARDESLRTWASRYARLVFERCGRNKRRACRILNISYHTLEAYLRATGRSGQGRTQRLPRWVQTVDGALERS